MWCNADMSEQRIILTGDLPWPVPGERDWTDQLAQAHDLSYEAVVHMPGGLFPSATAAERMKGMDEYVASAPLAQVPELLRSGGITDVYVIDWQRNNTISTRLRRRRRINQISKIATQHEVSVHEFVSRDHFKTELDSRLQQKNWRN